MLSIYDSETAHLLSYTKLQGTHRQWVCSVQVNKEQGCRGNSLVLVGLERLHLHYLQQRIKWKIHYNDSALKCRVNWEGDHIWNSADVGGIGNTNDKDYKYMHEGTKHKQMIFEKIALTWSRVSLRETAGTHSSIRRMRPDFTSFRVYHWNRDVHLMKQSLWLHRSNN